MATILSKKKHICDLCGKSIDKGEHYVSTNYFTYRFKSHVKCHELVNFLNICDYTEDNTVNHDSFDEFIRDEYSLIMSEKYTDIYESVDFNILPFDIQLEFVYDYYIIEKNEKISSDNLYC